MNYVNRTLSMTFVIASLLVTIGCSNQSAFRIGIATTEQPGASGGVNQAVDGEGATLVDEGTDEGTTEAVDDGTKIIRVQYYFGGGMPRYDENGNQVSNTKSLTVIKGADGVVYGEMNVSNCNAKLYNLESLLPKLIDLAVGARLVRSCPEGLICVVMDAPNQFIKYENQMSQTTHKDFNYGDFTVHKDDQENIVRFVDAQIAELTKQSTCAQ